MPSKDLPCIMYELPIWIFTLTNVAYLIIISLIFNLMADQKAEVVNEFRDNMNIFFDNFTTFRFHPSPNLLASLLFTKLSILEDKTNFCRNFCQKWKKIVKLTWFVFNSWKWNMTQKLQGRHGEFEPGKAQPFLDWLFLTRLFLTEILKLSVPNKVPVLSSKIFVKLSKLLATYFDLHQISPEWHYI